jgi:hypothetical protein
MATGRRNAQGVFSVGSLPRAAATGQIAMERKPTRATNPWACEVPVAGKGNALTATVVPPPIRSSIRPSGAAARNPNAVMR